MMTVKQAAEQLNVSARFVYRLCASGTLECFKLGSTIRIERRAVERYLEACKQGLKHQPVMAPKPQLSILKLKEPLRRRT